MRNFKEVNDEGATCISCGDEYDKARYDLGYRICLDCGEGKAISARKSWCIAPLNKSNYILITQPETLSQLNPKRTV